MKHKRPPVPVIVVAALVVLLGGYFGIRALLNRGDGALSASGTIEAVEISIAPELGGKVADVLVDEGSAVQADEVLFRLDETLLQAQRAVSAASLDTARAAVQTAQAQYDLALDSARLESASTRTATWRAAGPAGYTLPGWYFGRSEEIAAAQAEVDTAKSARYNTQLKLYDLLNNPTSADFLTAEQRLINSKAAYVVSQDVLNHSNVASDNADLQSAAQTAYNSANTELYDAQAAYDDLSGSDAAKSILTARADLAVAQERYAAAQDRLLVLQTGENSPKVAAAEAAFHQAEMAAAQAEANLALIDTQIEKLTVRAPADGVILTRSIEPGEVVVPSAVVMTVGRLDDLTITVYVPEDRYGELSLGQSATVTVDSFPGESFKASVTHIADQAEFTPRNVQTVQGRKSTVFAIKLKVEDPSGKLKPGMPADVTFQ